MGWGTLPVVPWWEKFSSNIPGCSSIRFKIKLEAFYFKFKLPGCIVVSDDVHCVYRIV